MSVFIEKKSACQWTCSVQACVIQGSAVFAVPNSWGYDEMGIFEKADNVVCIHMCDIPRDIQQILFPLASKAK